MNDCIDLFLVKDLSDSLTVQHICLIESKLLSGNLLHPLQSFSAGIVQIIHHNYFITFIQELNAGMTSDIPGSSGN